MLINGKKVKLYAKKRKVSQKDEEGGESMSEQEKR